jgi:hypothetical protein
VHTGIGVGVTRCPFMEVLGEVNCERASSWEGALAAEHDRHARLVVRLALFDDAGEVGEVLSDDDALLAHCMVIDGVVTGPSETNIADAAGIVTKSLQLDGGGRGKHLVDQPNHDDKRRSRLAMTRRARCATFSSAAIKRSISSGCSA